VIAERMAKDCLILASSGVDLAMVAHMADTAVTLGADDVRLPFYQFAKGLAEYRQGNFPGAAEWMRTVLAAGGDRVPFRDLQAQMVLAMAQHRLGHADQARTAFSKGAEIIERNPPNPEALDLGPNWHDWLIGNALMNEAKALIGGTPHS
jgi:hypothetical protein